MPSPWVPVQPSLCSCLVVSAAMITHQVLGTAWGFSVLSAHEHPLLLAEMITPLLGQAHT